MSNPIRLREPSNTTRWLVIVYDASVQQLKSLVYVYRKQFEATNPTTLVASGYKYLLNEVICNSAAPEAQFYFIIAFRGFLRLAQCSSAMCGICRAFFSLGTGTGIVQLFGAESLREEIQRAAASLGVETGYSSSYPIDLEQTEEDVELGNMESLATEFQQHTIQSGPARDAGATTDGDGDEPVWRGVQDDLSMTLSEAPDMAAPDMAALL